MSYMARQAVMEESPEMRGSERRFDSKAGVSGGWPVDAHVHFHKLERVEPTLNAAATNFSLVRGRSEGLLGAILLAEGSSERVFEELESRSLLRDWTSDAVPGEPETLLFTRRSVSLAVVCGRQVRTSDGLEVLALGTRKELSDGLSFSETAYLASQSGALTVIPWGFGKWLGQRGRKVEAVLTSLGSDVVFVGDNGGRLGVLGRPELVKASERKGFRVLPGSDPFPVPFDHQRVGRFGFLAEVEVPSSAPWRTLRTWLLQRRSSPTAYGRASGPLRFMLNQVGIQVRNRIRVRP